MMDMIDEIIHLHIPPTSNQLIVSSPPPLVPYTTEQKEGRVEQCQHSFIHSSGAYIIKRVQLVQIVFFVCVLNSES